MTSMIWLPVIIQWGSFPCRPLSLAASSCGAAGTIRSSTTQSQTRRSHLPSIIIAATFIASCIGRTIVVIFTRADDDYGLLQPSIPNPATAFCPTSKRHVLKLVRERQHIHRTKYHNNTHNYSKEDLHERCGTKSRERIARLRREVVRRGGKPQVNRLGAPEAGARNRLCLRRRLGGEIERGTEMKRGRGSRRVRELIAMPQMSRWLRVMRLRRLNATAITRERPEEARFWVIVTAPTRPRQRPTIDATGRAVAIGQKNRRRGRSARATGRKRRGSRNDVRRGPRMPGTAMEIMGRVAAFQANLRVLVSRAR